MAASVNRRFYTAVQVEAVEGGFRVLLDRRPLKTPAGRPFVLGAAALAQAVAAEWNAQGKAIDPRAMPHTRIVATALDRPPAERAAVEARVLAYAATDSLCYRVDGPADLAARQAAAWDPPLDWAAARFGGRLPVTFGLRAPPPPADVMAAFARRLAAFRPLGLAALEVAVAACGSLVLGLALAEGATGGDSAFDASQVDEIHQMDMWGADDEVIARRARLRADLLAAARVLEVERAAPATPSPAPAPGA